MIFTVILINWLNTGLEMKKTSFRVCFVLALFKSDDNHTECGANLIYETRDPREATTQSRHMLQSNLIAGFSNLTNLDCIKHLTEVGAEKRQVIRQKVIKT